MEIGGEIMKVYPEVKKIAALNHKMQVLCEKLNEKIDCDGLNLTNAYLISGCSEKNGHLYQDGKKLDNSGPVDNEYYCKQYTGVCEDDFYGTMYFKTDVPGQFIAVPFWM